MIITIITKKRSSDWHAQVKGQPVLWANGGTRFAAIGNLVATHCEVFGINIKSGDIK